MFPSLIGSSKTGLASEKGCPDPLVSIPHRKFKNDHLIMASTGLGSFPSLIGSSKTCRARDIAKRYSMFPSLIGSSKTKVESLHGATEEAFPSLIGSSKTRPV